MREHSEGRSLGEKPGEMAQEYERVRSVPELNSDGILIFPDFGLQKSRYLKNKFLFSKPQILMEAPAKTNSKLWKVTHGGV